MNELIQLYLDNKHTTDKWGNTPITHTRFLEFVG